VTFHRFIAWFSLGLALATAVAIWFVPPVEDFQPDNPFWNGSRQLKEVARITPISSLAELPPSPKGVTLIVIPYREFDGGELELVSHFVDGGGTLVLADDFGWGNQLLEYLGLAARFSGKVLLDPLFNYKSRWLPRVGVAIGDPLTAGLEHLTLNYATVLEGVTPERVLATSSSFSFLDGNGNGLADPGEPLGRQAVMSREAFGEGQVVLLGDPSVFISGMLTGENLKLAENIARTSEAGLYFDQSHLTISNLRHAQDGLRALRGFVFKPPVSVAMVAVVLALVLLPVWCQGSRQE
jgi:hypothetical protein